MAVLLATLGRESYRPQPYYLEGAPDRRYETAYAPAATAALLGGVAEARLLLTPEARTAHEAACRAEFERLGLAVKIVPVPRGRDAEELWQLFREVVAGADGAETVVLDVTHGFRHLPFVLFAALTYLGALRGLAVRRIAYGAFEARGPEGVPIFDLTPLLRLVDWYHAVRMFVDTGHPGRLAELLRTDARQLFERFGCSPGLENLKGGLEALYRALPVGLPLEGGLAARRTLEAVGALGQSTGPDALGALVPTLLDPLRTRLQHLAVGPGPRGKGELSLDLAECDRQLRVARWYLDRAQPDRTVCLLREWMLNRWLVANGGSARWLDYAEGRALAERALNAWSQRARASAKVDSRVPHLWQEVAEHRNRIAHCGFTLDPAPVETEKVRHWLHECEGLLSKDEAWRSPLANLTYQLLVAPVGWKPGSLFTALVRLQPAHVVIITSREARPGAEAACQAAGWSGPPPELVEVEDAFLCLSEVGRVLERVRPLLLGARRVSVSLTGGTTAMQYLAERVAAEAARLGVPVGRYAMLDRRSEEAQRSDPFVAGECVALDGEAENTP